MRVCGCDLTGSDAVVAVVDGTPDSYELIVGSARKFSLGESKDAAAVKDLLRLLEVYFREYQVDRIVIKQRAERGNYAGGPTSFKIEGLVQAAAPSEVVFMSPPALARHMKAGLPGPSTKLPKYQLPSYFMAIASLPKDG
jgi:hypothetical protein